MLKTLKKNWKHEYFYLGIFFLPFVINPWGFTFYELPKVVFLQIFVSATLAVLAVKFFFERRLELRIDKRILMLAGLWGLSLLLSTIFSIAPWRSFFGSYSRNQGLIVQVYYLLHFLIFLHFLRGRDFLEKCLRVILVSGVILSVHAIFQKFGFVLFSAETNEDFLGRVFSTLGHPNFLGQYLLVPLWIALHYVFKTSAGRKFFHAGIFFVLATALVLTENRASLLAFGFSVIIHLLWLQRTSKQYRKILIPLILVGLIGFIVLKAPSLRSFHSRWLTWQAAPVLLTENILAGSGLETLELVFPKVYPKELLLFEKINDRPDRMHSEPLDILLMQGLFGFAVYCAVLGFVIRKFLKYKLTNDPFAAKIFCALMALFIANLFGFASTANSLLFFSTLAMLVSLFPPGKKYILHRSWPAALAATVLTIFICGMVYLSLCFLRGDLYLGAGFRQMIGRKPAEGVQWLVRATEVNPYQGYIAFLTGYFLTNFEETTGGNPSFATEIGSFLEKYRSFEGDTSEYYGAKGRLAGIQGQIRSADEFFRKAHELAPSNPAILLEWGKTLFRNGEYDKTILVLEKYLNLIPPYWQWTPMLDKKTAQEKEQYRIFFKHAPLFWEVYDSLLESLERSGKIEQKQYYEKFLKKPS